MAILNSENTFINIWFIDLSRVDHDKLPIGKYINFLDKNEFNRYVKTKAVNIKRRFLLSRVLLRCLLSEALNCQPQEVSLSEGKNGRPELIGHGKNLSFNISHSGDMIVCAVAPKTIGVDIENADKKRNFDNITGHYFHDDEKKYLSLFSGREMSRKFFTYWTLKEAYLKSKGKSILSLSPEIFFSINNGGISFEYNKNYKFAVLSLKENYIVALALDSRGGNTVSGEVSLEEMIPLFFREKRSFQVLASTSGFLKQVTSGEKK